jgi:hypothetical protein
VLSLLLGGAEQEVACVAGEGSWGGHGRRRDDDVSEVENPIDNDMSQPLVTVTLAAFVFSTMVTSDINRDCCVAKHRRLASSPPALDLNMAQSSGRHICVNCQNLLPPFVPRTPGNRFLWQWDKPWCSSECGREAYLKGLHRSPEGNPTPKMRVRKAGREARS